MLEYVRTGRAPQLSICADAPVLEDDFSQAVEAVAEVLLNWQMLDGDEIERVVEAGMRCTCH